MAGRRRWVAGLALLTAGGTVAGCDSKSELATFTHVTHVCRFISPAKATEAAGQPMTNITPIGGANPNGTLCEYENRAGSSRLSVGGSKGHVPRDLPAEGTVVDSTNVAQYPGLGLPAGSQLERTAVHLGEVGGASAAWYRFIATEPGSSPNTFLVAFPKQYGVFVITTQTTDDVAAAKRAAATVVSNLP